MKVLTIDVIEEKVFRCCNFLSSNGFDQININKETVVKSLMKEAFPSFPNPCENCRDAIFLKWTSDDKDLYIKN
jgi:hypothetical protein